MIRRTRFDCIVLAKIYVYNFWLANVLGKSLVCFEWKSEFVAHAELNKQAKRNQNRKLKCSKRLQKTKKFEAKKIDFDKKLQITWAVFI